MQVVMLLDKRKVDAANATLAEVGPHCATDLFPT
jgi:hypothetical protein